MPDLNTGNCWWFDVIFFKNFHFGCPFGLFMFVDSGVSVGFLSIKKIRLQMNFL